MACAAAGGHGRAAPRRIRRSSGHRGRGDPATRWRRRLHARAPAAGDAARRRARQLARAHRRSASRRSATCSPTPCARRGDADVALNNNSLGGLRADLPDGPVTFGQLYDTFPFDNRLVRVNLNAGALEQGIANALRRGRPGAFGISGARVRVSCSADGLQVQLFRPSGQPIRLHRIPRGRRDGLAAGRSAVRAGDSSRHRARHARGARSSARWWKTGCATAVATCGPNSSLPPTTAGSSSTDSAVPCLAQ